MAFVSLSMLELVHSFNIRSDESIFRIGVFKNIYLIGAVLLGIILCFAVVLIPQIAKIFEVTQLNKTQWIITLLISISPIIIMESQKLFNRIKFEKKELITMMR